MTLKLLMGNVGHARMHQEMTRDRKLPVSAVPHGNVRGAMLASQAAHAHGQQKLSGTSRPLLGSSSVSGNGSASIATPIRASLQPWQALERAAAVRKLATQQQRQQHPAETKATSSSSTDGAQVGLSASEQLSGLEAHALLDLFFTHLLPPSAGHGVRATATYTTGPNPVSILLPYELQQAEGKPLIQLLRRIWAANREDLAAGAEGIRGAASSVGRSSLPPAMAAKGAGLGRAKDQCSSDSGSELIREIAHAASLLGEASCGVRGADGSPPKVAATGLPYVLLRRLSIAMLHVLHGGINKGNGACTELVAEVCVDRGWEGMGGALASIYP